MFDLNEKVNNISVFNNGVAGKTVGVSISVEKKQAGDADNQPDYKLVVLDESGAEPIKQGFFIDENHIDSKKIQTIQRIKSIAEAIVPADFVYPEHNGTYTGAANALFKVINDNSEGKKVDVFTSYGYISKTEGPKPSKYLGLRMFNFIQKQNASFDRLKPSNTDILERPEADAPKTDAQGTEVKKSADIW